MALANHATRTLDEMVEDELARDRLTDPQVLEDVFDFQRELKEFSDTMDQHFDGLEQQMSRMGSKNPRRHAANMNQLLLKALQTRIRAEILNAEARRINHWTVRRSDEPLISLVSLETGDAIDGFPRTVKELDELDRTALVRILEQLEQFTDDTTRRLRKCLKTNTGGSGKLVYLLPELLQTTAAPERQHITSHHQPRFERNIIPSTSPLTPRAGPPASTMSSPPIPSQAVAEPDADWIQIRRSLHESFKNTLVTIAELVVRVILDDGTQTEETRKCRDQLLRDRDAFVDSYHTMDQNLEQHMLDGHRVDTSDMFQKMHTVFQTWDALLGLMEAE
ncbi:hypothetical protein F5Y18DRAFT_426135 [Xylariaceae sp. FL1019]|nr:hypothetical protein F5Y18DRAFT_426135 [Xylariaceae sp. FL1019]